MQAQSTVQKPVKRVPIREDLFTTPLDDLKQVRLKGSRCRDCGEVFMGKAITCAHCSGENMEEIVLSNRGTLWTYTLIQYQPPGEYKGPVNPFVPFAEGLVELPDGIRIVAPIKECSLDAVKIGMPLELVIHEFFQDEDGNQVVAFYFKPASV